MLPCSRGHSRVGGGVQVLQAEELRDDRNSRRWSDSDGDGSSSDDVNGRTDGGVRPSPSVPIPSQIITAPLLSPLGPDIPTAVKGSGDDDSMSPPPEGTGSPPGEALGVLPAARASRWDAHSGARRGGSLTRRPKQAELTGGKRGGGPAATGSRPTSSRSSSATAVAVANAEAALAAMSLDSSGSSRGVRRSPPSNARRERSPEAGGKARMVGNTGGGTAGVGMGGGSPDGGAGSGGYSTLSGGSAPSSLPNDDGEGYRPRSRKDRWVGFHSSVERLLGERSLKGSRDESRGLESEGGWLCGDRW